MDNGRSIEYSISKIVFLNTGFKINKQRQNKYVSRRFRQFAHIQIAS